VLAQPAYQGSPQVRTLNVNDHDVPIANAAGFNAYVDVEQLGDSLEDGLLYVYLLHLLHSYSMLYHVLVR
jgi:hypothetical protein